MKSRSHVLALSIQVGVASMACVQKTLCERILREYKELLADPGDAGSFGLLSTVGGSRPLPGELPKNVFWV